MRENSKIHILLAVIFFAASVVVASEKDAYVVVSQKWNSIVVRSHVPYPPDIDNETQARALAREAAITQAQDRLLTEMLSMTTKSGKPLSVAEVPSLETQSQIRDLLKEARIKSSTWEDKTCTVILELAKKKLKRILKNN